MRDKETVFGNCTAKSSFLPQTVNVTTTATGCSPALACDTLVSRVVLTDDDLNMVKISIYVALPTDKLSIPLMCL